MKSYDYEAVVLDGEIYCVECCPELYRTEPIFADSEWDHFPICMNCGTCHDYVNKVSK